MLVSVIVPTFNSTHTITRAVNSVLAQSLSCWELIIVDDGSTDGTGEFCRSIYSSDPRTTVVVRNINEGPAAARNYGISLARGEWIALLDSDDAWYPDRLSTLLDNSEASDFIADNVMTYDVGAQQETGLYYEEFASNRISLEEYITGRLGGRSMDGGYLKPLMRHSFLKKHNLCYHPQLRHGEDYIFYCEALCLTAKFRVVNYCGYLYSTPMGRISKRWSPYSHTHPDPVAMAAAMAALLQRYHGGLSALQKNLFASKIKTLQEIEPWWRFEDALRTKQYFRCIALLRWRVVQHGAARALRRKIEKRLDLTSHSRVED